MPTQLAALRKLLEQRFPDAAPLTHRVARPVATGVPALDRILPGRGLPRGRLTAWTTHGHTGGAMAVMRAACRAVVAAGERSVWIHGAGTVGPFWKNGPLLVRPAGHREALRSAELLLRSGGFGLVVLTGTRPERMAMVRLTRAVRDGGGRSAFVVLTAATLLANLRLTSRILPDGYRWRHGPCGDPALPVEAAIEIQARALGWNARTTLALPIALHELRLSLDPELADRRGTTR
jgi:hypothetical protein